MALMTSRLKEGNNNSLKGERLIIKKRVTLTYIKHDNIASIVPLIEMFCRFKFSEICYIFKDFTIFTFSRVISMFHQIYTHTTQYDSELTVVVSTFKAVSYI